MARLNDAQKLELCHWIAARAVTSEIIEHFQEKFALELSPGQIYSYRSGKNDKKWLEIIVEKRKEFDAAVDECFFSAKRNRLDSLYEAFLIAKGKKDAKGMVMAVAQAQKEMEGTKVEITGKDGKEFSFNINIGPPPEAGQKTVGGGPVLRLLPSGND